ncbi:orotidine-5'-phosphate decarboxylase [Lentibacillus cibarius]|uniref:Orotidine 5'-phosphate decarboxylase n=2 Tax=Lentibacillus cibarius TaxID=2583219 RepID=A0A549YKC8_9BACI|nr:orotidine-5'-phosphate decarboxylase [Lentibacillus cibarius]
MKGRMYLALDFPGWKEAKDFIDTHHFQGVPVKVGMELFYREGPQLIENLKQDGHNVFLDLKLHDIPTTVMKAMENIAKLDVDMVTIHALGGSDMIKKAKDGLLSGAADRAPKLIAVTMLTSADASVMNNELHIPGSVEAHTIHLAQMAHQSGADGVVCSVREAQQIKDCCGSSLLAVTPGIRLRGSSVDDQKRPATPREARMNGSDVLVLGRTVRDASDPVVAYENVKEEWNNGAL